MKFITSEEAKQLAECYKLGCLVTSRLANNNDMLDLINSVSRVRALSALLEIVFAGNLPVVLDNGTLTIVCDKAESLEQINSGGFIHET